MTFAERHAKIEVDPLKEMIRRTQLWASCPGENGERLFPSAKIIPEGVLHAAIVELISLRARFGDPSAKALYNEYCDTDH